MSQIVGELLQNKLNNPIHQVKYDPGMYDEILPGALVIVDWRLADQLRDATIRAVQSGAFKRMGVLMLLDRRTMVSKVRLHTVNMCLHVVKHGRHCKAVDRQDHHGQDGGGLLTDIYNSWDCGGAESGDQQAGQAPQVCQQAED